MLNLPQATELNKFLPKKTIYAKFNMKTSQRERFDADISRIVIVNEISSDTTAHAKGDDIEAFFVLLVTLKQVDYDERNIILLSKLIPQKMLFVLQYEEKARLAVYHTKLMQSDWKAINEPSIQLKGLNLDTVWNNIIVQIGDIQIEQGNTLDEQLVIDERQRMLQKQIDSLERQARAEKQPRRKFELVQEIKKLMMNLYEI
jgi:hypothetical protein